MEIMLCWAAAVVVGVVVFQFFLISVFGTSPRRHFELGALASAGSIVFWRTSDMAQVH